MTKYFGGRYQVIREQTAVQPDLKKGGEDDYGQGNNDKGRRIHPDGRDKKSGNSSQQKDQAKEPVDESIQSKHEEQGKLSKSGVKTNIINPTLFVNRQYRYNIL